MLKDDVMHSAVQFSILIHFIYSHHDKPQRTTADLIIL
jgi:hypothetical protein